MKSRKNRGQMTVTDRRLPGGGYPTWQLVGKYTLLFAIFFFVFYSPFWLYGKAFLWDTDGYGLHLPTLFYSRFWAKTVLNNLLNGRLEIPFWSLWVGFGQNTIGNVIGYRPFIFLYALLPRERLELYLTARIVIGLYLAGLSFITYARTRTRNQTGILLGCMIYLFSGFFPFFVTAQWSYMGFALFLPLMLLGVDQVFEGKWSFLFIFSVFKKATVGYYQLFLITLPAVIYAFFHYFELSAEDRSRCGGFFRILLRHIAQYLVGVCLAAVSLIPALVVAFDSSRFSVQKGVNLLHWNAQVYLDLLRGFVDVGSIANSGRIALPSLGVIAILYQLFTRRKRDRTLWGQIMLYDLAFLLPGLTMLFSAFAGKNLRWCYVFSFWTAIAAACLLTRVRRDRGDGYRFCRAAFFAYSALYLIISVWTGEGVTLSLVLALLGFSAFYTAVLSDWGRSRRRLSAVLLLAMLLVEVTAKSYEYYSPQYENAIARYLDAGTVLERIEDNAVDALEMARDDALYRVDILANTAPMHTRLLNYGVRERVNGLSSYFPSEGGRIVSYSLELGNAHQKQPFKISDLDQRTVLNELAGVKYAVALEADSARLPYGYELMETRDKVLSDGSVTKEHLYKNRFALPLSYAYEARISREVFDALPPNRKEQAMLQGVVLEEEVPLSPAELAFDDEVLLDDDAFLEALREASKDSDALEVSEGLLFVKKPGYSVSIPIDPIEGEVYLQFQGMEYRSVNYNSGKMEQQIREGANRITVMNTWRASRQWTPDESANITVSSGGRKDYGTLLATDGAYYFGKKNLLLNLGYGKSGKSIKVTFSQAGEYSFDSVQLIRQPMESYSAKVEPLLARQAKAVEVDGNDVTVEYDLDESAFACLTIPYTDSWSVTVDGEKAEILPANGMYMGVMLDAGRHTIVFHYTMRGFREGAAVSLATLIGLLVFGVVRRLRRYGR